jgi:hypothetical protein
MDVGNSPNTLTMLTRVWQTIRGCLTLNSRRFILKVINENIFFIKIKSKQQNMPVLIKKITIF